MLTETNQSLLSWEVSQPLPYAQEKVARCRRDSKKPLLIVEASLKINILTLTKEAIVLICDSTRQE